ncbi:MAG: hypothetical protein A2040_07780 [Rhodocyclales bacterium GWA2_65_19]|nr:MAG: hypothetical protein A2040_07780 [Rhodocyclales bacterium GWA2_65_19]
MRLASQKGEAAVEKALARRIVAAGVGAHAEFAFMQGGKLAALAEEACRSAHLARRLQQQVRQRGMQRIPRHELHRRADQEHVVRRNVPAQIERTPRQLQLVQYVDAADIAVGLDEAEQAHAGVALMDMTRPRPKSASSRATALLR